MNADQGHAVLEALASPMAHTERAPWHAEDIIVDIGHLENCLRNSKTGYLSPFECKQPPSTSLCGAVGSLATMPFRYLSRRKSKEKICNISDGCCTGTGEAISAFTPFPENSSDFLRSENSSDSHDAGSYHALPRDELESSLSALSISQSSSYEQVSGSTHVKPSTAGSIHRFSWVGALKNAVTGAQSAGLQPGICTKPAQCAPPACVQCTHTHSYSAPILWCAPHKNLAVHVCSFSVVSELKQ